MAVNKVAGKPAPIPSGKIAIKNTIAPKQESRTIQPFSKSPNAINP